MKSDTVHLMMMRNMDCAVQSGYQVYCVKCIHPLEYCPKTGMIAGRVCHYNVGPTDGKIIQTLSDFSHGEFV